MNGCKGWQGWKVEGIYFSQLVSLSLGAILAGYTIKDLLPSVQDALITPPPWGVQFCVYFTLAGINDWSKSNTNDGRFEKRDDCSHCDDCNCPNSRPLDNKVTSDACVRVTTNT